MYGLETVAGRLLNGRRSRARFELELKPRCRPKLPGQEHAAARSRDPANVADRIVPVGLVEQVDKVAAELHRSRLANRKALHEGTIHVALAGPAQHVASHECPCPRPASAVEFWALRMGWPRWRVRIANATGLTLARRNVANLTAIV